MKYEEFTVGSKFESEAFAITDAQLDDFARDWDPLPAHVRSDTVTAPSAPGLLTMCAAWRAWVGLDLLGADGESGLGFDKVAFKKPVFPDEKLVLTVEVLEQRLTSKGKGLVCFQFTVTDSVGDIVLAQQATSLIRRSTHDAA